MKIIEVLHSFWTGNRTESPRNRKSWVKIEKAIKEVVPQDKQEDFTRMIEDHSDSVEYSGFVAGFRILQYIPRIFIFVQYRGKSGRDGRAYMGQYRL